jgi:hypothetical protein
LHVQFVRKDPNSSANAIPYQRRMSSGSTFASSRSKSPNRQRRGKVPLLSHRVIGYDVVVSPKSRLTKPIKKPKATWVEPTFFADVEYRDTLEGAVAAELVQGRQAEVGCRLPTPGSSNRTRPSGLRTIPCRSQNRSGPS